jgi:hypothetical protein
MQSRRWVLVLVITMMLVESWVDRAAADSIEPAPSLSASQ